MKKGFCFAIAAALVSASASVAQVTAITAQQGWDIYTGGIYRYGPSFIINDDNSIDAWFAAPGGTYSDAQQHGSLSENLFANNLHTALNIHDMKSVACAFTSSTEFNNVQVCCPTWNSTGQYVTLKIYAWDTDYETTISHEPLYAKLYANFNDNQWLIGYYNQAAENDASIRFPAGRYLLLLMNPSARAGVWINNAITPGYDVMSYYDGEEVEAVPEIALYHDPIPEADRLAPVDKYWDQATYQHSDNGGRKWSDEVNALKPTCCTRDQFSICDPAAAYWNGYYYVGYTSTENAQGLFNHVYVARSKSPVGPWEKWNGNGWGGTRVEPVITFTGQANSWGAGEPSIVVVDGTIYFYYTWDDHNPTTRVATAPANDPNWPAKLEVRGTAIDKKAYPASDHCDVKYCEDTKEFIAVHTASRMTANSYIQIWKSTDGLTFAPLGRLQGALGGGLHNCGISGDSIGHINLKKQQYIGYAYGLNSQGQSSWGSWKTMFHPLEFTYTAGINGVIADDAKVVAKGGMGKITVDVADGAFTVYDLTGRTVRQARGEANVPAGVYVVRCGNAVQKVVVR